MTLKEFLLSSKKALEAKPLHYADSRQHIEQLVCRTLNWTPTDILLKEQEQLTCDQMELLNQVLHRRLEGEPLQYILGFEWFYRSRFEVGSGCLIPRKETELLVDEVLNFRKSENIRVAELGAGSGNIGISVLLERPNCEWHAFEVNPASAGFAVRNKEKILRESSRYFLHPEDFFSGSYSLAPYDAVVSNPPYVSQKEMQSLPLEVKKEPVIALEAGEDGLNVIRSLLDILPNLLKSDGLFLSEIGSSQEENLRRELEIRNFKNFDILPDLAGLPRVLKLVLTHSCRTITR